MTTGHLVAGLQAALDRNVDLDHLLHTGRQFVARGKLFLLLLEHRVELDALLRQAVFQRLDLAAGIVVGQTDVEPVMAVHRLQIVLGDLAAFGELLRSAIGDLQVQQLFQTRKGVAFDDAHAVGHVLFVFNQLRIDDRLRAAVPFNAFAGEYVHVDHHARHAGRHLQAGVFHIAGFFAKNGTQQLFFRRQLGFTLGRDLADQHVARLDFRTDGNNAGGIQAPQLALCQVGDITGNFFRAELGIARHHRQFLDVNRGVAVFGDDFLVDQNRVFEVVAVPRHEGDQHVLAQRQLAHVGRGAIGDDVAAGDDVAHLHQRTLVDVGVLV